MDNVSTSAWVMIAVTLLAIETIPLIATALAVGGICGWFLPRLSVKRGLLMAIPVGLLCAVAGVVLFRANTMMYSGESPLNMLVGAIFVRVPSAAAAIATLGLCFRWDRNRGIADAG